MRTQKWNVQECCYLKKDLATIYVVDYHYPKTSQRGGYRGKGEDKSEFVGGNAVDVETDIRTMKGRREDRVPRFQLQTLEREHTPPSTSGNSIALSSIPILFLSSKSSS